MNEGNFPIPYVLTIPGTPQPRKPHAGCGTTSYDPQYLLLNNLKHQLKAQFPHSPIDEIVIVDLILHFPVPKYKQKKWEKMKERETTFYYPKTPDRDNVAKLVFDALQPHVLSNDCLVVDGYIRKLYSDSPRVEIRITPIGKFYELL